MPREPEVEAGAGGEGVGGAAGDQQGEEEHGGRDGEAGGGDEGQDPSECLRRSPAPPAAAFPRATEQLKLLRLQQHVVQHVDLPDKWQQEQERRRFFVTFRARQYSEASFVNTHPIPTSLKTFFSAETVLKSFYF